MTWSKWKTLNKWTLLFDIKVKKDSEGYSLSYSYYIKNVINKFDHLNIKETNNLLDPNIKLVKNNGRAITQIEYASTIESLVYAAQCAWLDIAFALSKLNSNPNSKHWKKKDNARVLGYLKKIKNLVLQYTKFSTILEGYTNDSWISSSGSIFTLGGGIVSWKSNKQTCITHTKMELEFVVLAEIGKEA